MLGNMVLNLNILKTCCDGSVEQWIKKGLFEKENPKFGTPEPTGEFHKECLDLWDFHIWELHSAEDAES